MLFIFIIKYKLLVLNPVSVLQIFLLLILRPVNGIESRHVLITSVLFLSNFRYSFIICNRAWTFYVLLIIGAELDDSIEVHRDYI
jgi:hypothetical protein